MTVSSAFYGVTLRKFLDGTIVSSGMQSTNTWVLLVDNTEAPDFDGDTNRSEILSEITGSGYTAGGAQLSTFGTVTFTTPTSQLFNFTSGNPAWATSTISNAEAAVLYNSTGVAANDELFLMSDFGTAVSTANGTLTVTVDSNGWVRWDYNPN